MGVDNIYKLLGKANYIMNKVNKELKSTKSIIQLATEKKNKKFLSPEFPYSYKCKEAIDHARIVDNKFGLCSEESRDAWKVVVSFCFIRVGWCWYSILSFLMCLRLHSLGWLL